MSNIIEKSITVNIASPAYNKIWSLIGDQFTPGYLLEILNLSIDVYTNYDNFNSLERASYYALQVLTSYVKRGLIDPKRYHEIISPLTDNLYTVFRNFFTNISFIKNDMVEYIQVYDVTRNGTVCLLIRLRSGE